MIIYFINIIVYFFFVGKFAGFARMSSLSRRDIPHPSWVLPSSMSVKSLGGVIEIDWICRNELSFNNTTHLYNPWNDGKPIKIGRDGQEIEPKVGAELCRLFPEDESIEMTPILRKSKETAKIMRDKGIHVIYKPPKSIHSRNVGGGIGGGRNSNHNNNSSSNNYQHRYSGPDRRDSGGGIMRHKRSYLSTHRPYKLPHILGSLASGFKRSGAGGSGGGVSGGGNTVNVNVGNSPHRSGPASAVVGNVSRVSCSDNVPPWERYISPTAAAEAYLADYMRTMHGQLPPLPFVPPFGQLPLPTPTAATITPPGVPGSLYEQLPPPVRYYDGPPLPDYPPPQTLRGPPPGFDKSCPSFEDFAAWKHAGLPTGSLPSGFPSSISGSNSSSSNTMGGNGNAVGLPVIGSNNQLYRNNRTSDSTAVNSNRLRERPGGRPDYHRVPGGSSGGGGLSIATGLSNLLSSRNNSGGDRDRHFRSINDHGARNYRDNRR